MLPLLRLHHRSLHTACGGLSYGESQVGGFTSKHAIPKIKPLPQVHNEDHVPEVNMEDIEYNVSPTGIHLFIARAEEILGYGAAEA